MAHCTGIHHVALSVRDLAASTAWYERVFTLEHVMDESAADRNGRVYRLGSAMLGLTQHDTNDGSEFAAATTGLDHVALAVDSRDGIDRWVEHLDDLDIVHSGAIDIPVGAILNFHDPDGVQLSVFWER